MSELTLTVLRLGFLVLLWVLVLSVVGVPLRDLFGTRAKRTGRAPAARPATAPPREQPAPRSEPAGRQPPPEPPRPAPARRLVVTQGSQKGASVPLAQAPVLIGRAAECTLVLSDDYASSRHARIYREGERWLLEDLGSTNGTVLGQEKVTAPVAVDVGAQLRIGRTVLELQR